MFVPVKDRILPEDHISAQKRWEKEHSVEGWNALSTRTKNRLIKEEVLHREYHSLCDAIKSFR